MDTLDYPCGCSYQLDSTGIAFMPARHQCTEHRRAAEQAAATAEAAHRRKLAQEADQPA